MQISVNRETKYKSDYWQATEIIEWKANEFYILQMLSLYTFFGNFIDFLANFIQSLINLGLVLQHEWLDNSVVDRVSSIPRYRRHAPAKEYKLQNNTPDYNLHEEQAFFKSTNAY